MSDLHEPESSSFGKGIKSTGEQVTFLEKSNETDGSVEGVVSRMTFTGHFAIDGYVLQYDDGRFVDAGLGADFDEYNGPKRSWIWFSAPVNDAVKEVFENFFSATFDDDRLHMEIKPEVFLTFADSDAWGAFSDGEAETDAEDDELLGFLG